MVRHRWLSRYGTVPLLASCIPLLAACGAERPEPGVSVYDSAGVTIAISREPLRGAGDFWAVGSDPIISIGVLDGPVEYQFTTIVDAWRYADGRVVVGDRDARQIRIFDATGTFLRVWGREGEGPGEFRHLSRVLPYRGDSILAWDTGLKRVTVFDSAGGVGRTQRVDLEMIRAGEGSRSFGLAERLWGALEDGSLTFVPMTIRRYEVGEKLAFERPVVRVSATGDRVEVVAPGVVAEAGGLSNPLPRMEAVATAGDRLYIGAGEGFVVEVRSATGEVERIVRVEGAASPVDDELRRAYIDYYRDQQRRVFNRPAAEVERDLAELQMPLTKPPYSALLVDALGHLWVEEYRHRSDPRPATWRVFAHNGRWLGTVRLPPEFVVQEIGVDYVLGVRTDELGVQTVEAYELTRGG